MFKFGNKLDWDLDLEDLVCGKELDFKGILF